MNTKRQTHHRKLSRSEKRRSRRAGRTGTSRARRSSKGSSSRGSRSLFFFKQKTAYEISTYWSSDVCSSDLTTYWADQGKFAVSAGERSVMEQMLGRLN